nr:MAG TPA: hypothetical protein [Caudoviricetes sp.]
MFVMIHPSDEQITAEAIISYVDIDQKIHYV